MRRLRILIADDHEIVRRGLIAVIKGHPDSEVCAECSNGSDAVAKARDLKPDIAILDIGMPVLNGFEATRQILRENPDVKVLILTLNESTEVIRTVLSAGARGFLLKSDATRDLVAAVEALRQNRNYFTSQVSEMILAGYLGRTSFPEGSHLPILTAREREIVQLLAEGWISKEVASHLNLSVKTAETHRSNIMRKLGVHSISELVLYAVRNNIIHVTPALLPTAPIEKLADAPSELEADAVSAHEQVSL